MHSKQTNTKLTNAKLFVVIDNYIHSKSRTRNESNHYAAFFLLIMCIILFKSHEINTKLHFSAEEKKRRHVPNVWHNNNNKMLSYRRETALQGAL